MSDSPETLDHGFDRALAAARQTSPDDYLTTHLRALAQINPAAVRDVLARSSLTMEQRVDVAMDLGLDGAAL